MSNVIDLHIKRVQKMGKASRMNSKVATHRIEKSNVSEIDFKSGKLIKTEIMEELVEIGDSCGMAHFETPPADSNFADFTDAERYGHSEHILQYLKEFTFSDLMHFVKMGVLDQEKLAKQLGVPYSSSHFSK